MKVDGTTCVVCKKGTYQLSKLESTTKENVWHCNQCSDRIRRPTDEAETSDFLRNTSVVIGIIAAIGVGVVPTWNWWKNR
jgi:DNA-directed RNA polymerase subunit RPC12/RpoP